VFKNWLFLKAHPKDIICQNTILFSPFAGSMPASHISAA
jgi:hypothetical protein